MKSGKARLGGTSEEDDLTPLSGEWVEALTGASTSSAGDPANLHAPASHEASLDQILDAWAAEAGQGDNEQRQEAVTRTRAWVEAGDVDALLDLSPAFLTSLPALPAGLPTLDVSNNRLELHPRDSFGQQRLSSGELPEKMGLCASKPHTADATSSHSSHSSSASTSSPARPSTSLFEYRTAELHEANENGICVGLTAEWLLNLNRSASARMNAILPGSEGHASAAMRQQQYQNLKHLLLTEGAGASQADLQAHNTILREAGLAPSGKEKKYTFGESSSLLRMISKITEDGSTYLVNLYFSGDGAHTVAMSSSNGVTTLFDPNYGEFTVQSREMSSLFQSLTNRYRNPNRLHLSTITTQRMH
ncbi:YopT-type cysteine protease domain-containing protein [Mesorhizobium silamurunense]|uniref:YopT-type cysteine protease domain-containing protein n=1 Tax=Mesorhizobium silamurunense TaxID=499528 RepID=UPI0028A9900F|nr:YopT-type cysteine protease domain-containing protein [Mesorhizobium silamurunense]